MARLEKLGDDELGSTYQIRPKNQNKFQPSVIKEIIQEAINEELDGKSYNANDATDWCKVLTEQINEKIKDIKAFKRYKYIVQVVVGERRGQGMKIGSRCLWDADTDNYASAQFLNETIFCVATVYGIYYY